MIFSGTQQVKLNRRKSRFLFKVLRQSTESTICRSFFHIATVVFICQTDLIVTSHRSSRMNNLWQNLSFRISEDWVFFYLIKHFSPLPSEPCSYLELSIRVLKSTSCQKGWAQFVTSLIAHSNEAISGDFSGGDTLNENDPMRRWQLWALCWLLSDIWGALWSIFSNT